MNEDKASRYHRLVRRARCLELLWSAGLLTVLLMTGASAALRDAATAATAAIGVSKSVAPVAIVAFYVTLLTALHESLSLDLAYYRGHLIESRYGLSTESAGRWLGGYLKAALIGFAFAQVGACVLYFSVRTWPGWGWMITATAFSLAALWLTKAAPMVILPLFCEFKPIERDGLHRRLVKLARDAGTAVLGVYGWTLSDSTRKANAALVGIGQTRCILLSDTLLTNYSDDEVEVVLAHELAHHVHGDIWRGLGFSTILTFASFCVAALVLRVAGPHVGVSDPSDVAGLPLVVLVVGALSLAVLPLANAQSREHERRADRFALRLTRNPAAFASAMRRLAQQNLAEERPSRLVQAFFCAHPPFADRLQMARQWKGTLLLTENYAIPRESCPNVAGR
jgi:STE24 endopeptidase